MLTVSGTATGTLARTVVGRVQVLALHVLTVSFTATGTLARTVDGRAQALALHVLTVSGTATGTLSRTVQRIDCSKLGEFLCFSFHSIQLLWVYIW